MRRLWTALIVIGLAFATALAAGAARPDCDVDPTHPSCGGDGIEGGTTCMEAPNAAYRAQALDDFPIPEQEAGFYCVDVSDVRPGDWKVYFDVTQGRLRSLILQVRDSVAPGDVCDDVRYFKTRPIASPATLDVSGGDWVNACGIEYAENINGTDYWLEDTGTRHPLAFMVWADGSKDLVIDILVDIPPLEKP